MSDLNFTCICTAKAWVETGYFLDQVMVAGSWTVMRRSHPDDDEGYLEEQFGDVPTTHQIFRFACARCGRRMLVDAYGLLGYDDQRPPRSSVIDKTTFHRHKPDPVPTHPVPREELIPHVGRTPEPENPDPAA